MGKITKHNICQNIEEYLKSLKVRYDISHQDNQLVIYELHISSTEGNIQIEYNLDDENDDNICIQFFTNVDSNGLSIYHSDWDSDSDESIEGEIDELISSAKRINQGISKIRAKIDHIRDICEEYNLDFEEFITLEYNFDE